MSHTRPAALDLPRDDDPEPYLQRVGLDADILDRHPRQLSGGQRVAVAGPSHRDRV